MTDKFARHLVMLCWIASASEFPICDVSQKSNRLMVRKGNEMKNLATFLGVALILTSSVQFASAASGHHKTKAERVVVRQQSRNPDAYAYWPSRPAPRYDLDSRYSGGWSAPAGQ
jgi:hypothetical protein